MDATFVVDSGCRWTTAIRCLSVEWVADVLRAITSQVDWWWSALFRPRLSGLSDEEFLWEPASDCWTLHDAGDAMTSIDGVWPPPTPPPVTTIAWRMHHIGVGCLVSRTKRFFPELAPEAWDPEPHARVTPFPLHASGAIAFLERWWSAWRAGLGTLTDERLWEPLAGRDGGSPEMGLGDDDPFIHILLHNHRELIHHGAEMALLRDLYRDRLPKDPFVVAALRADEQKMQEMIAADPSLLARYRAQRPDLVLRAVELGRLDAVRVLLALGFDVNDASEGRTPLHHAVAGGQLDMAALLLKLGADPHLRDREYSADAIGWATHFQQHEVRDLLTQHLAPT